ncbi:4Fe-4S binding protein, partial [bacterium]|nr:4Fe-4S binding protein [bacterium]
MALLINDLCIACDVCLAPCPNKAISAGEDIFYIDP